MLKNARGAKTRDENELKREATETNGLQETNFCNEPHLDSRFNHLMLFDSGIKKVRCTGLHAETTPAGFSPKSYTYFSFFKEKNALY